MVKSNVTIQNKILCVLLALSIVIIGSLAMFAQWSFGQGLINYVNSKEKELLQPFAVALEQSYAKNGSWDEWKGQHQKFFDNVLNYLDGRAQTSPEGDSSLITRPPPRGNRPPPEHRSRPEQRPPPEQRTRLDQRPPQQRRAPSFALLGAQNEIVSGKLVPNTQYSYLALYNGNQQIGRLAIATKEQLSQDYEFEIVAQQQQYLILVVVCLFLIVFGVSLVIARHFVSPIKAVVEGMTQLTRGNYKQAITTQRKDELGTLSQHFNTLAQRLSKTEANRKRWLATVSHELRTPVAILKGETEALLDGVRKPNQQNLTSIHNEINQLSSMIDDLYALTSQTLEDIGVNLKRTDLLSFLGKNEQKYRQYLADKNIDLLMDLPKGELMLDMDSVRINQLFENLFSNCVKYASASQVKLSVKKRDKMLHIVVEDNGDGIDPKHFAHIFEYLYRVEEHRKRRDGGLGLGLAICAQIVNRHHGNIYAKTSLLGGLAICIDFPLGNA